MISKAARSSFYVSSGAVPQEAPCYVMRDADLDLHAALTRGEFCYLLAPRQSGKSSLIIRAVARLREENATAVYVDLAALGVNLTADQWYLGILECVGAQIELEDEIEAYWYAHRSQGPMSRCMGALREVVLARTQTPVFLFIDGVEATRRLPFPAEEFFAAIRGLYQERARVPALNRLGFCLSGIAAPAELVKDPINSPFLIGHGVELVDFTEQEAQVLLPGLSRAGKYAPELLKRILYWTGGQPCLTQRLCQAVAEDPRLRSPGGVDRVAEKTFLPAKARESDDNLLYIRERMLRGHVKPMDLLTTYLNVWTGRLEKDDPANATLNELRLAGVVRSEHGYARVKNPIYQRVFDRKFVEENQPNDETKRQQQAERRGRMQVLMGASGLVGAFGALAITAWISSQTTAEKNSKYESTAIAGMNALSNAADQLYQLTARHPELSSSYAAIAAAGDSFVDGMLEAHPHNPSANDLKVIRLSASIAAAVNASDSAAAHRKIQECVDRAEDLKDSTDIRLQSVAARFYATAGEGFGKLGESTPAENYVKKAEDLAGEISVKVKPGDDFTKKNISVTYAIAGGAEAAMDHWERAVQSYQRTATANRKGLDLPAKPGAGERDFQMVHETLETRNRAARTALDNRDYDAARRVLEEHSLAIAKTLVKWNEDPSLKRTEAEKDQAIADLRDVEMQLGDVLAVRHATWQNALAYYVDALNKAQPLAQNDPSPANIGKQEDAALAVARTRKLLGQNEAALGAYNKYIALLRRHDTEHPSKDTVEKLGFAYHELAAFEARHGTKSAAPADYQNAIEWLSKIARGDPAVQRKIAGAHIRLADVETGFGQNEQARDNYARATRTSEKCVAYDVQHSSVREGVADSALLVDYENLAFGKLGLGDRKGAQDAFAKLLERAKAEASNAQASLDAKKTPEAIERAAIAYNVLGWAELLNNNPQESIRALESVPAENRNQAWIQANLAHAFLLSGQFDHASSVYLAHLGEQMYDDRFEISVLDDLDELNKLGFDPPALAKVQKLLTR
ncbi:MAG TPA: AAA-like domain-containing protein [Bryobacteraceae bacterium]|nr:AAA-like domain-containing protein [Bryobacteraceae bacterium]